MGNHPNRSARGGPGTNPLPDQIRGAREAAGLTQTEAAERIYSTLRAWQDWEAGARRMHPGLWELWELKTGHLRTPARVHERLVHMLGMLGGQHALASNPADLADLPEEPGVYLISEHVNAAWHPRLVGPADNLRSRIAAATDRLVKDTGASAFRVDYASIADHAQRQKAYGRLRAAAHVESAQE